jgi:hypothetical protein
LPQAATFAAVFREAIIVNMGEETVLPLNFLKKALTRRYIKIYTEKT